jgi:hypothetical protein
MEPHSGVLEDLRRSDLQRSGALEAIRAAQDKEIEDHLRDNEALRLGRVDEIATRMKAIDSPGVSRASRRRSVKART